MACLKVRQASYFYGMTDLFLASLARTLNMTLNRQQGDAIRLLLNECLTNEVTDLRQIAYVLATVWHESRFKSIREIRAKPGTKLRKVQDKYWFTGYFGRGFVQITWLKNYKKFSPLVGVDLVNFPDKCLEAEISAKITVIGMKFGLFTGVGLSVYFPENGDPRFLSARRIINGTDKAQLIATAAYKIWGLLKEFEK